MAIAFDAASSSLSLDNTTSHSHTLGAGSDRVVVMCVSATGPDLASLVTTAITYNGVTATQAIRMTFGTAYVYAIFYVLEADLPAAGTHTAVYNITAGAYSVNLHVISLTGVAQEAPTTASNTSGGTDTITTNISTTEDNSWLVDNLYAYYIDGVATPDASQTQRTLDETFEVNGTSTKLVATAGADSMTWDNVGNTWGTILHCVAAFKPAGGGGGGSPVTYNAAFFGANF